MTLYGLYSPDELLSRPIEHVLEALPVGTLAQIWGVGHGTAGEIKAHPYWVKTQEGHPGEGLPLLTWQRTRQLRDWLEEQA